MSRLDMRLDDLTIDDVVYVDGNVKHFNSERKAEIKKFHEVQDDIYDSHRGNIGIEPGCSAMRPTQAMKEFELSAEAAGGRDYTKWLHERKILRRNLEEGTTDTNTTMLAHDKVSRKPLGGVGVFSTKIVGKSTEVVRLTAYAAPFMVNPNHSVDFMLYLLDNRITGRLAGQPTTFQLVEWRFPINTIRNRWDVTMFLTKLWIDRFRETHALTLDTRGGQTFMTSLKKRRLALET